VGSVIIHGHLRTMFRTRVLYLWLQMVGLAIGLLATLAIISAVLVPDFKLAVMLLLLLFPLTLAALATLILLGLPMLVVLQRLLIAVGSHAGRLLPFPAFAACCIATASSQPRCRC
jgi:hypothetical protein